MSQATILRVSVLQLLPRPLQQKRLETISIAQHDYSQFIIMYDGTNKETVESLLTLINQIKPSQSLPILISIGQNELPRNEYNIVIKEIENNGQTLDLIFDECITNAQRLVKKLTEFNNQLSIIKTKADSLRADGHIAAADKADTLHDNLKELSKTYFNHPTQETHDTFKAQAKEEIHKASEELGKHRGWKKILGNIGLAILGLGVLYLAAVLINRNVFFTKTNSAKNLDQLEALIDNNTYQM